MKCLIVCALLAVCSSLALSQGSADACLQLESTTIGGRPAISWQTVGANVKLAVWTRQNAHEPFKVQDTINNPKPGTGEIVSHYIIPENEPNLEFFVETLNDTAFGGGLWRTGYINTGVTRPAAAAIRNNRIVLIIDEVAYAFLAKNIELWTKDLVAEGFVVAIHTFDETVKNAFDIKKIILRYAADKESGPLTHVLLCGRVPYAYSGGFAVDGAYPQPDGHPEHGGAWASDAYYADAYTTPGVDAEYQWTDKSVNIAALERPNRWQNRNVPNDGKFDQSIIPTDLELCVGRLDMRNLPVFGTSESDRSKELELIARYFAKNHAYRSGTEKVSKRAIVDDNFGVFVSIPNESETYVESFAASGYRSFAPIVGRDNIFKGDWFPEPNGNKPSLDTFDCLFAYGCGPGGYNHCDFVGLSSDFQKYPVNAVFTLLFGSYFGDVDSEDNFMRCALAAEGKTLTTGYSGRPQWFLHQMSDGTTIGECARVSANNQEIYIGSTLTNPMLNTRTYMPFSQRYVHVLLLGDPSLNVYSTRIEGSLVFSQGAQDSLTIEFPAAEDIGEPVTYAIEASTSLSKPFRLVGTFEQQAGPIQRFSVQVESADAFVRVRPVVMPNKGRVSPIAGRGVVAQRNQVSVDEETIDSQHNFRIVNFLGNTVGNVFTSVSSLGSAVQSLNLVNGAYWAICPGNSVRTRGLIVLH
ncbi:MAG: hypothetical protein HQ472_09995 [Ignavibacteria bacterium]|nr:hypothetical protein [Ignavibacteria bacterium]